MCYTDEIYKCLSSSDLYNNDILVTNNKTKVTTQILNKCEKDFINFFILIKNITMPCIIYHKTRKTNTLHRTFIYKFQII